MAEPRPVKWSEETVLAHLMQVAEEQLNLTPQQLAAIGPDSRLQDALQLDSLAKVVLATTIEHDFGFAIELEEWQQVETVGDLVKAIASRASPEPFT